MTDRATTRGGNPVPFYILLLNPLSAGQIDKKIRDILLLSRYQLRFMQDMPGSKVRNIATPYHEG